MKKIGVMGGTFDPVHNGHFSLAKDALQQVGLNWVIFMPASIPPFKQNKKVAAAEHRVAMLEAAVANEPGMDVSTLEMEMEGVSYTERTLSVIRSQLYPEDKLYFITGTDSYLTAHTWMNADRLLTDNAFIVGERPGYKGVELRERIRLNQLAFGTETIIINNERLDISSTEIRERAAAGRPLSPMVPSAVEKYILEHGLYKEQK